MRTIILFAVVIAMVTVLPWAALAQSDPLADPAILKALDIAVTTGKQQVAYVMAVDYTRQFDGAAQTHTFNVIYDPFATYGIDLRVQVLKADMHKYDEGDIKKKLDEIMGLQLRLLSETLFDENSLRAEKPEGDSTVFSFKFDREALPRGVRYFEYLRGYVYVSNGALDKIVLTNEVPFEHADVEIETFRKALHFSEAQGKGGALLNDIEIEIKGRKDNRPYGVTIAGRMVKYWNETKQNIAWKGGMQKRTDLPLDDRYKTIYIDLDRPFPLLGKAARKAGYDLPKPFGLSMVTMLQQTTMRMTSFELDGVDVGNIIGGDEARVENSAAAVLLRADMWLLPFMNVGLLAGKTSTSSDITLQWLPNGALGGLIKPGDVFTLEDSLSDTTVYGVGTTLAGGIGNYFGTVDFQYITSYTAAADAELSMAIATPMVGYSFIDYGARIMAGAQYQDTKEQIVARLTRKNGTISRVVVGLESTKWAALIGVDKSLSRHWNCSLMLSQGEDRSNLNLVIGYRF